MTEYKTLDEIRAQPGDWMCYQTTQWRMTALRLRRRYPQITWFQQPLPWGGYDIWARA